jgi:hypothetical protein
MLDWDWCGFHKKHDRTSYIELSFLHPLGYAGHIVHSVHPRHETSMHYFFMLVWDRKGFHKKRAGTREAKLVSCIQLDLWVT